MFPDFLLYTRKYSNEGDGKGAPFLRQSRSWATVLLRNSAKFRELFNCFSRHGMIHVLLKEETVDDSDSCQSSQEERGD